MSRRIQLGAQALTWLVIIAAYAGMLWADLPGFLTVDSFMSLHEGHFGIRESWNPAIFGWLLGIFDAIHPGTALFVVANGALLFGAWFWLTRISDRVSWATPFVIAAVAATPNVLIYQGIVWKDILFANTGVLGFVALAAAAKALEAGRRPWLSLGLAALLLAVAALARQNGVILWVPAALAVAWSAQGRGPRRWIGWSAGWLAAAAAFTLILSVTALPQKTGDERAMSQGLRVLQFYDLAGALAADPTLPLPAIEAAAPQSAAVLRKHARTYYGPDRVDHLDNIPDTEKKLGGLTNEALRHDWLWLIAHRPGLYLQDRVQVFRWTFATPIIDKCLPVSLGADGIAKQMADLKIPRRWDTRDQKLYNYATWYMDTPVLSHVAYGVLAIVLAGFLLWRRRPADVAMAGLQVGALGFAGSFFVISIACDYRYLYFLDLAAITGLVYVAMDLGLRRPR